LSWSWPTYWRSISLSRLRLMFTSPITRPLRWAIPVAVLGGVAALLWFIRPLEVTIGGATVDCREYADVLAECGDLRLRRYLVSGLILLIGVLPLIVVVVRACVWSADTLHSLREEVRRLSEKLDGKS
jgi:hypothetical protein